MADSAPAPVTRPAFSHPDLGPVVVENRLAGSSGWRPGMEGTRGADDRSGQIKGFTSASSVEVGGSLDFRVSLSEAGGFSIGVYRFGHYAGRGARKITESPELHGGPQPAPRVDDVTGLTTCPWAVSWSLAIADDWVSGLYVAVFTSASGWRSYAPFVVRDGRRAALCVVVPSTTYQAYNQWPLDGRTGRSLYHGYTASGGRAYDRRAVKVSFDRPYAGNGLPGHLVYDQQFIMWVEREGYDVTYVDSTDVHAGRVDPSKYQGLVFGGHDVFWSAAMRQTATGAVERGTSLAFMTANNAFCHIRLEGTDERVMVCYRNDDDPEAGPDGFTGKWRNRKPWPAAPEQAFIGVQYCAGVPAPLPLIVQAADHWFWADCAVADGDQIEALVGGEADTVFPKVATPAGAAQTLLAATPFERGEQTYTQHTSLCEYPTGAVVFAAGTLHWNYGLGHDDRGDERIRRATANLFDRITNRTARQVPPRPRRTRSASPVVAENRVPGSSAWRLGMEGSRGADDIAAQIKGFASASSVEVGGRLDFRVSLSEPGEFSIGVYRLGFYAGRGARKVIESPRLNGGPQPPPHVVDETGLITCPWDVSWSMPVGLDWLSGLYVAVFTSASGWRNYAPFVVRDGRKAALCVVVPSTTYQAYNQWPLDGRTGRSLYFGFTESGSRLRDRRAAKVSFDRPYSGTGLPNRFDFDRDAIRWMEQQGYDVTYVDSVDLHAGRVDPTLYRGIVFCGHDEYWSAPMREHASRAVEAGTSLVFLTANNAYWHVRLEKSPESGDDRVVVCHKWGDDREPDPTGTTAQWREVRPAPHRPEQALLGVQYNGIVAYPVPLIVQRADHWVWRGTGVVDGDALDSVVGGEADGLDPTIGPRPGGRQTLLSASPYPNIENDDPTNGADRPGMLQNTSIWEGPKGTIIFVASSLDWGAVLSREGRVDPRIQRATANVFDRIVSGRRRRWWRR